MTTGIFMNGAYGRMGKMILQKISEQVDVTLLGACDTSFGKINTPEAQMMASSLPQSVLWSDDLEHVLKNSPHKGVIIDFTSPHAIQDVLDKAIKYKTPLVIGTTGFDNAQLAKINEAGQYIPVLLSPNMSLAVNVLFYLAEQATHLLGESSDIEIFEAHHNQKKDAPSGTALELAKRVCEAGQFEYPQSLVQSRQGQVGARPKKEIGMQVIRGGDIVGEHTVYFCSQGERLELTHRATNRETFALGAIRSACWLSKQTAGFYSMKDVLGV